MHVLLFFHVFSPLFYTSLRKEEDQYQHIHIYFFLLLQANGNVLHTHSYRKKWTMKLYLFLENDHNDLLV